MSAQAMGELQYIDQAVVESGRKGARIQTGTSPGQFVWPSLIRKLDRIDRDYAS
jgi:hypothetical protein